MRKLVLYLPLLLVWTVDAAWLSDDWHHRSLITCDSTLIAGTTKTNFPVLITMTSAQADIFNKAQDDGDDIRFTKVGGDTLLTFELVSYDSVAELAEFWVLIPSFGDLQNTLYVYYGNPAAPSASSEDVWADYAAVAHYDHSADYGYLDDATTNELLIQQSTSGSQWNDASPSNAGKIGNSWVYDFGETTYTTGLDVTAKQWSLSAWVFLYNDGTDFIAQGDPTYFELAAHRSTGSHSMGYGSDGSGTPTPEIDLTFHDGLVSLNSWHFMAWQMVASGDSMRCFLNGTMDATALVFPDTCTVVRHGIGAGTTFGLGSTQFVQSGGPDSMNGLVDELRVRSGTPPNANWLLTEYRNQNSPQTFYAVAAEETRVCE